MAGGSRGGRGGKGKAFRGKGNKGGGRDVRTEPWGETTRENELFESYYKLGGFLDEEEFRKMWATLATNLPNSFRFTGTKADALAVREIFKQRYIPGITAVTFEGQPVNAPEPVQAFPDELVWHMKTDKKVIRRFAPFAEFQKFLVAETTSGNISRQEVVSMIPPHFLDVKPGMVVLDMCAAPGSKSAQLAEMIHGDEEERVKRAANNQAPSIDGEGDYSDDGRSTGLLIANDTDYKRAGMLVHQVKRLNFPNLIVTQHDAAIFPSIELPVPEGSKKQYLKYDRILADVPCSGDGTARKNVNVWQKWTPRDGLGLHNLQLRILFRGLQMLKKGGRLVYSTCSMNPIENEAVIASAIENCGGVSKVQLVDCSDHLPNLIRKPGLNTWKVLDTTQVPGEEKTAHMFTSWETFLNTKEKYEKEDPDRHFSNKIYPGVFPPPIAPSEEERIPLERCIRVYPHLQDTGGFFVAVLEKLSDIKVTQIRNSYNAAEELKGKASTEEIEIDLEIEQDIEPGGPSSGVSSSQVPPLKRKLDDIDEPLPSKKAKNESANEQAESTPTIAGGSEGFIPPVDELSQAEKSTTPVNGAAKSEDSKPTSDAVRPTKLKPEAQNNNKEYFEYLPSDDPTVDSILSFFGISSRFPRDRFMVKNKQGLLLNKIYYTSELARTIISQNKDRGMRFIHCGVVMFVAHKIKAQDHIKAPWRLQNEGIRILEPWAKNRIITCKSSNTLYKLLIEMFPKLPKDGSHNLAEIGDQLNETDIGCCFLRIEQDDEAGFPFPMVLPLWRHPGSANLMVDKDDRKAILLRLFNEANPNIINHVAEQAKAAEDARKEVENGDKEAVNGGNDAEDADADTPMVVDA
ncbi:S-adenosyl-L-methionine-dependent methyltransferase [Melanomma pulvis-pyrius CBS 109.77]|uniref:S-adenosyl-L-methionine-dependent methyltransferase n=1 Tax=Melanomma pulvis-pyrius CBS 109.77 TaxID=1314802 RepID=A0A6A6XYK8_9PLEO|nr:S-adenosyl-L-methionine-dependent methyltransferase [Melanomma pulvis-pyrius CBS 109.77]